MRAAAEDCGEVTKIVLYDLDEVLTVRFKTFEAAELFAKKVSGRGYNNARLQITIAEDRPRFRKSMEFDGKEDHLAQVEESDDEDE